MKKLTFFSLFSLLSLLGFSQVVSEDFTSGLPAGWGITFNSDTTWQFNDPGARAITGSGFNGNFAIIDSDNRGNGKIQHTFLTTSSFSTSGNNVVTLKFAESYRTCCGSLAFVKVSTNGGTSWDTVATRNSASIGYPTPVYTTVDISSQAGNQASVMVEWDYQGSFDYWWAIDSVEVEASSVACLDPTALNIANVTSTSVDLGWTENNSATNWEIEWDTTGFTLGTGNSLVTTTNPHSVSGLTANTSYDWYVRSICTPGSDTSGWSPVNTFNTACNTVSSFPYLDDFENPATLSCWGVQVLSGSTGWGTANGNSNGNGTITAFSGSNNLLFASNNYNGDMAALISPTLDITGLTTPRLTFQHSQEDWGGDQDTLGVYYRTSSSSPLVYLTSYNNSVTSWTKREIDLPAASATYQIVFIGWSGYGYGVTIDDFVIEEKPACVAPSALMTSNVTATSLDLAWTENNGASTWEVEWDTAGFTPGTGNRVVTMTNPHAVTGLSAGTSYDWYVRTICGSMDTSAWSSVNTFLTPPDTASGVTCGVGNPSITFSDELDAQGGWTGNIGTGATSRMWNFRAGGTGSSSTGPSGAHSGTGYVYYEASSGTPTQATIVSPAIDLTAASGEVEMSFYMHAYGSTMGTFSLGVGTSASGPFTAVFGWNQQLQASSADAWQNVGVDLTAYIGSTIYLQFDMLHGSNYFGDMAFDNIEISTCASCAIPSNLTTNNITATSVDLGWTENGSATTWEIEWDTAGYTPGTGNRVITTTNPHAVSGLTPSSSYDWYVRSVCGSMDTSAWSAMSSFATPCVPAVAPFSEGFSGGNLPACWSQGAGNSEDWLFTPNGGHVGNVGNMGTGTTSSGATSTSGLAAVDDSSPHNTSTTLETPLIDVSGLTTPRLTFYTISDNEGDVNGNVDFHVDIYDGAAWNDSIFFSDTNSLNGTWEQIIVDLTTLTITGPIQIRFVVDENNGGGFDDDRAIDDVVVEETPSCIAPTILMSANVTTTSVDLDWTENNAATQWEIEYGLAGFTPGTGSRVSTSTKPHNLTGLMPSTDYDWYVRSHCSPTDSSSWSLSGAFATLCAPVAAPFMENFDGLPLTTPYTALPNCWVTQVGPDFWDVTNDVLNTGHTYLPNIGDHTTGSDNYMWIDASQNITANEMVTLDIDMSGLTTPYVGFWFASNNTTNNINHEIALDAWDGTAWVNIAKDSGNYTGWVEVASTLPAGIPDTTRFRVYAIANPNGTASDYYFNDLGVDDFFVMEAPLPPLPYYPIATINTEDANGDADSAGVSCWTSGTVVGIDLDGNNGYSFTIVDMASGVQEGMNIHNFNDVSNYVVTEGDSIMIRGFVKQFNGLTEVEPDSIRIISSGHSLPAPMVVADLDETTESIYLSIPTNFWSLSTSGTGSSNVNLTNGTDTITMRIDSDTDINDSLNAANAIVPGDTICGLFGVGGQFDNSSPYTGGYQIFPMRWSDLTICRNTIGIDDNSDNLSLSIYPNPSTGLFTITTSGLSNSNAQLVIRDISGKIVYQENIIQANQAFVKTIDISDKAKGVYFLNLVDGNSILNEKLIVK